MTRPTTMLVARHETAGGCTGSVDATARGVADWLSLAAAPTFAIMALLTGIPGAGPLEALCSVAHGASPLHGMVVMYLLMSAFHSSPWLRLIFRQVGTRGVKSTG